MKIIRQITLYCALGMTLILAAFFTDAYLSKPEHVDRKTCAIYISLFHNIPEKDVVYFKPMTIAFEQGPWGTIMDAPTTFAKRTGEIETIQNSLSNETYKEEVWELFEYDITEFFDGIFNLEAASLKKCFKNLVERPKVSILSFRYFRDREWFLANRNDIYITQWHVTKPVFSKDGTTTLIYAKYFCDEGLCGNGSLYLFEKTNSAWHLTGQHTLLRM